MIQQISLKIIYNHCDSTLQISMPLNLKMKLDKKENSGQKWFSRLSIIGAVNKRYQLNIFAF